MSRILLALLLGCIVLPALVCPAAATERPLPHLHPPIGVFGEQVHAKGQAMLSYRFQRVVMDDLMMGRTQLSAEEVQQRTGDAVVPSRMVSSTHLFEAMWVALDEITFVASIPFIDKKMWNIRSGGGPFTTRARGFGDARISLLYRVYEDEFGLVHLNIGLSLPSGATNVTDMTPMSGSKPARLPYIMQLGSGTIDLLPGFTYNGRWRGNAWGAQISGVLHAGTNKRGYTLGNRYSATGWFGRRWLPWLDTSFRMNWQQWSELNGEDDQHVGSLLTGENRDRQDGRRLDVLFSLDFYAPTGGLRGARLALEAGLPAYQYLDGPQLRTKWLMTAGIQYAF